MPKGVSMNKFFVFVAGIVLLSIMPLSAKDYNGAEMYSKEKVKYGRFDLRLRSIYGNGVVSAFLPITTTPIWEIRSLGKKSTSRFLEKEPMSSSRISSPVPPRVKKHRRNCTISATFRRHTTRILLNGRRITSPGFSTVRKFVAPPVPR